jgi:hypothetical protein
MKAPSKLEYERIPGVKVSIKKLTKSIIRKAYLTLYRLPIDKPIVNSDGLKGVFLVASYTDNDKGYLKGMIESSQAFEKLILYHDKTKVNDFDFNESIRFQQLVRAARRNGARWVLVGSPKTRFSREFKHQIKPLVVKYDGTPTVLALHERYLWNDFNQYAYPKIVGDDLFIEKFFSLTDHMVFDGKKIHATQRPINYTNVVHTTASRYYLGRFNLNMMKKKQSFIKGRMAKTTHICMIWLSQLHIMKKFLELAILKRMIY